MKWGDGLCGSCSVGPYLVCKDGPVFDTEGLREIRDEFGHFMREASGKRVDFRQH